MENQLNQQGEDLEDRLKRNPLFQELMNKIRGQVLDNMAELEEKLFIEEMLHGTVTQKK